MENEKAELQEALDFQVKPVEAIPDFQDKTKFRKMNLDKSEVSMLMQSIVPAAATGLLSKAYYCRFPEGLPHTLMKFKTGGYGSAIMGKSGIIDQASYHRMVPVAAAMGIFTVMSAITGQYFLSEINSKLDKISQNVSDILAFLYGDKKAELISEISFVQYAQKCYASIMRHEVQQTATISGIQNARKVAMKDIEFYLNDLEAAVKDAEGKVTELSKKQKVSQIINSLELSLQLYIMCCILEPYYSRNFDHDYLDFIIEDTAEYVSKYRDKIRSCLGMMHGGVYHLTEEKTRSYDLRSRKAEIEKLLDSLPSGEAAVRQQLEEALYAPFQETNIYLTDEGEAYYALT